MLSSAGKLAMQLGCTALVFATAAHADMQSLFNQAHVQAIAEQAYPRTEVLCAVHLESAAEEQNDAAHFEALTAAAGNRVEQPACQEKSSAAVAGKHQK